MTTDETRKLALDALKLVRDCKITLRDQAVVDAAIAAIEQYKPVVRMLTDEEAIDCECDKFDNTVNFPSAESIAGRHVHIGGIFAKAHCCDFEIGEHG